jgi:hypothetical protein
MDGDERTTEGSLRNNVPDEVIKLQLQQETSLKSETVKYGRESQGTRTRERLRWQGPVACKKDRPVLSSERVPHKKKNKTVTLNSNKYLVMILRRGSTPGLTD